MSLIGLANASVVEIAGYSGLEPIGRGGFAVVYKARQISVGRDVAIKLLTDPSPDDDLIRRFRRESQAVGALSWHPHIAAVVDAGSTEQGQAYIVFELLSGGSLEERIEETPMAWHDAVSAMIQIADAVEAAHNADVLHRDIKPANILLDRLGVAKLGDFGIASMQDGNKTETGMLATTVAHAAPELFDGAPASTATDVYALGSTLHTLLAGDPPFLQGGDDRIAPTIARILHEPPPRLDDSVVPSQVSTVIAHALAKQPQYRPRTAAAFGQALQQAQVELGQPMTNMPGASAAPLLTAPMQATTTLAPQTPAPQTPAPQTPAPQTPAQQSVAARPQSPATESPAPQSPLTVAAPAASFTAVAPPKRKPWSRTITVLSVVAILLAIGVGLLVAWPKLRSPQIVATTRGGAMIIEHEAFDTTEMPSPFDGASALDQDDTTYWGVNPSVNGTWFEVKLSAEQRIIGVGISNGQSTELGRVSGIEWGTAIVENRLQGRFARQEVPDEPGDHAIEVDTTTDRIVVVLTGAHGDAVNAGVAEILIEVEGNTAP